jgi:hypothetical protein
MNNALRAFITSINGLCTNYHFVNFTTLKVLFNAYCTSFYGYQFFYLSIRGLQPLYVAWKKSIRRVFRLHPRTRSRYVDRLLGQPDLRIDLMHRFAKFWTNCNNSTNSLISTCVKLSPNGFSSVDCNVRQVMSYCRFDNDSMNVHLDQGSLATVVRQTWTATLDEEIEHTVDAILELIAIR